MKIKEGFILRNVGGQAVVVAVGEASKVFNGMIKLNSTGEFLWRQIMAGADEEQLVKKLSGEYDVDEVTASDDVAAFVKKLKNTGII